MEEAQNGAFTYLCGLLHGFMVVGQRLGSMARKSLVFPDRT